MKIDELSAIVLLIITITSVGAYVEKEPWTICKNIASTSPIIQLKRTLLCDYDSTVRPTLDHRNATVVTVGLLVKRIIFNDYYNTADVHTWTILKWNDTHLTWDPQQYNDIKLLHVTSDEVWMPTIAVNDVNGMGSAGIVSYTNCWVSNEGQMYCVLSNMYSVSCFTDHFRWPYDLIYCTIDFNTWASQNPEITFSLFSTKGVSLSDYRENPEWNLLFMQANQITDVDSVFFNLTMEFLIIDFLMERNSMTLHIIMIAPVIVLVVMTLVSFWLHPKSSERLLVSSLNFICHLLCIHDVHWKMPDNGSEPPMILYFYENSLMLATIALLLTTILPTIQRRYIEPPTWISLVASNILKSRVGQILLLSILDSRASVGFKRNTDDVASLLQSNEKESAWDQIIALIGWVAFFAVFIGYVILLGLYLPAYNPVKWR